MESTNVIGRTARRAVPTALLACAVLGLSAVPVLADDDGGTVAVSQINLVANRVGFGATVVDPSLVNAWGISKLPTSPVWISDNGTDSSTLYLGGGTATSPTVAKAALVVSINGAPTGQVANTTATAFLMSNNQPARFIFATEQGTIEAWNPGNPTTASNVATVPNGDLKGLAIAVVGSAPMLYAADFTNGTIDLFDSTFAAVTLPGAFQAPPHLPSGFAPFNVQVLRDGTGTDHVYVAYAKRDTVTNDEIAGRRLGVVAEFTTAGQFVRSFSRDGMNAPWGLAYAPATWGAIAGDLLVGQFGDGRVEIYDPHNGHHVGTVRDGHDHALVIDGLWALMAGDATSGGVGTLLFTAGPNGDGLYGVLTAEQAHHRHD